MTAPGEFSLPHNLKQSVQASAEVSSSIVEWAPNIVICNSDGYLYEIKDKRIVNMLNLNKEIGRQISCAYLAEKERLILFYLVTTASNKLLIIKRTDRLLEVTKIYENVDNFEVEDFKSLGYPQIKLVLTTSATCEVEFPLDNNEAVAGESECDKDLEEKADSLANTLQVVCKHIDEITEELYKMRELCQPVDNSENSNVKPVDSIKFFLPLEKHNDNVLFSAKWIQVIGGKLLLGMKISNSGQETVSDLEFHIYDDIIKHYSYRFFPSNDNIKDLLFSSKTIVTSIQPKEEIIVVGSVLLSSLDFSVKRKLHISCYLYSGKLKDYLLKETFDIGLSDVIELSNKFFPLLKTSCSVEHLHAIRTVKLETKLIIEGRNAGTDAMAILLEENLGFEKIRNVEIGLYYCTSTYLNEVFVALLPLSANDPAWKVILYTSDESQIYFLVNFFYDLLPDETSILLDEDERKDLPKRT